MRALVVFSSSLVILIKREFERECDFFIVSECEGNGGQNLINYLMRLL